MKKRLILSLSLAAVTCITATAQSVDPALAAAILLYSEKAENTLKAQEKVMMLETTGHLWIREEMESSTELEKEFSDYLDSFRGIVSHAAEIYGFYHEIERALDSMDRLRSRIDTHAGGALAVALSANRNALYRDIITGSVDIVKDIRQACFSGIKMTEKERLELLLGVRPKLKDMNRELRNLERAIHYTTLSDVWNEVSERQPQKADIGTITEGAMQRWKTYGKSVRP